MALAIPEGYKRCSRGDDCIHPDGPVLPATTEYFYAHKQTKNGLQSRCKCCILDGNRRRYHGDSYSSWKSKIEYQQSAPDGYRCCTKGSECLHPSGPMLPLSEFSPCKRTTDGLQRQCKECLREYAYRYRHGDNYEVAKAAYYRRKALVKSIGKRGLNLICCHRYHATKRGLVSNFTASEWHSALMYWESLCSYCGNPRDLWFELVQEHFVPVSAGGGYTADNIVPACKYCNSSKNNSDPHEWVVKKFGKRKGKEILARIEAYFEWVCQREDKAS